MYRHELETATRLAREASRIALEVYNRDFTWTNKADDAGPVTEADKRVNAFLVEALSEAFPDDEVIGEESVAQGIDLNASRLWIIDPIDGTKDFLRKNGEWSIMIGLAVDGRSEVGVVYQAEGDRLYAGAKGIGATVSVGGGAPQPLKVSESTDATQATLVNSRSHPDPTIDKVRDALGITNEYKHGSVGCKLAHISEGRADLYMNLSGKCHMWDTCGPEALIRAAGGVLLTLDGEELRYGGTDTQVHAPFFASTSALADAVIAASKRAL